MVNNLSRMFFLLISANIWFIANAGQNLNSNNNALNLKLVNYYNINARKPIHVVSDRFISLTIDPETLLRSVDCEITSATVNMAKGLSPAYMRIAGPNSNKYIFKPLPDSADEIKSGIGFKNLTITGLQWIWLNNIVKESGLDLIVSLNGGIQKGYTLRDLSNVLELITFSDRFNYNLGWQLGYELQKIANDHGRDMGRDVVRLRKILEIFPRYYNSPIIGPDMVSFETREDANFIRNYLAEAGDSINVFTWHPNFSNLKEDEDPSNMLAHTLQNLDNYVWLKEGLLFKQLTKGIIPKKTIWLAESENKKEESTFADGLSWVMKLGASAKLGISVYMRKPHQLSLFEPTPEYWIALFHKALVGRSVLDIKPIANNNTKLHIYSHCTQVLEHPEEGVINPSLKYEKGAITVFGVNTGYEAARISFKIGFKPDEGQTVHQYILTEGTDDKTYLSKVLLNGQLLNLSKQNELPMFSPRIRVNPSSCVVPQRSIFFFVLPDAKCKACTLQLNEESDALKLKKPITSLEDESETELETFSNNLQESIEEDNNNVHSEYVSYPKRNGNRIIIDNPDKLTKLSENVEPIVKYVTFTDDSWLSSFPTKLNGGEYSSKKFDTPEGEIISSKSEKYKLLTQAILGKRNMTNSTTNENKSEPTSELFDLQTSFLANDNNDLKNRKSNRFERSVKEDDVENKKYENPIIVVQRESRYPKAKMPFFDYDDDYVYESPCNRKSLYDYAGYPYYPRKSKPYVFVPMEEDCDYDDEPEMNLENVLRRFSPRLIFNRNNQGEKKIRYNVIPVKKLLEKDNGYDEIILVEDDKKDFKESSDDSKISIQITEKPDETESKISTSEIEEIEKLLAEKIEAVEEDENDDSQSKIGTVSDVDVTENTIANEINYDSTDRREKREISTGMTMDSTTISIPRATELSSVSSEISPGASNARSEIIGKIPDHSIPAEMIEKIQTVVPDITSTTILDETAKTICAEDPDEIVGITSAMNSDLYSDISRQPEIIGATVKLDEDLIERKSNPKYLTVIVETTAAPIVSEQSTPRTSTSIPSLTSIASLESGIVQNSRSEPEQMNAKQAVPMSEEGTDSKSEDSVTVKLSKINPIQISDLSPINLSEEEEVDNVQRGSRDLVEKSSHIIIANEEAESSEKDDDELGSIAQGDKSEENIGSSKLIVSPYSKKPEEKVHKKIHDVPAKVKSNKSNLEDQKKINIGKPKVQEKKKVEHAAPNKDTKQKKPDGGKVDLSKLDIAQLIEKYQSKLREIQERYKSRMVELKKKIQSVKTSQKTSANVQRSKRQTNNESKVPTARFDLSDSLQKMRNKLKEIKIRKQNRREDLKKKTGELKNNRKQQDEKNNHEKHKRSIENNRQNFQDLADQLLEKYRNDVKNLQEKIQARLSEVRKKISDRKSSVGIKKLRQKRKVEDSFRFRKFENNGKFSEKDIYNEIFTGNLDKNWNSNDLYETNNNILNSFYEQLQENDPISKKLRLKKRSAIDGEQLVDESINEIETSMDDFFDKLQNDLKFKKGKEIPTEDKFETNLKNFVSEEKKLLKLNRLQNNKISTMDKLLKPDLHIFENFDKLITPNNIHSGLKTLKAADEINSGINNLHDGIKTILSSNPTNDALSSGIRNLPGFVKVLPNTGINSGIIDVLSLGKIKNPLEVLPEVEKMISSPTDNSKSNSDINKALNKLGNQILETGKTLKSHSNELLPENEIDTLNEILHPNLDSNILDENRLKNKKRTLSVEQLSDKANEVMSVLEEKYTNSINDIITPIEFTVNELKDLKDESNFNVNLKNIPTKSDAWDIDDTFKTDENKVEIDVPGKIKSILPMFNPFEIWHKLISRISEIWSQFRDLGQ